MGMFDGIESASVSEKGKWFAPGSYEIEVREVLSKQTQRSGLCFIVGCKVLEASIDSEIGQGQEASWVQPFKNRQVALSAVKEFLCAVSGFSPRDTQEISEQLDPIASRLLETIVGPTNPARGMHVHLEVFTRKTQSGSDFTVHQWRPSESAPPDQFERLRAAVGPMPVVAPAAPSAAGTIPPTVTLPDGRKALLVNGQLVPLG